MPVINHAGFLLEFKKRCKEVKNATVAERMVCDIAGASEAHRKTRVNPMDCLQLIEPYVNRIDAALNGWRTDARFTIAQGHCATLAGPLGKKLGTYNVVKDAFVEAPRRTLVGFFASLIVPLAAIWVRQAAMTARAVRIADAGALPVVHLGIHAAVRGVIYGNVASSPSEFRPYNAADVAAAAAKAAGVTPPVVEAIEESGAVARDQIAHHGGIPATAVGTAAVAAALVADPTLSAAIQGMIRATANSMMTEPPISFAVTPQVALAFTALGAGTMVKTGIGHRETFFRNNLETLCLRLLADWEDINRLFFPNVVLKKLVGIRTTGADFHKEGKQVLILTFKAHASPLVMVGFACFQKQKVVIQRRQLVKLVYKPSDIELDWRMVGDSEATQARLPHIWAAAPFNTHSLFCQINASLNAAAAPTAPVFPARGALAGVAAAPPATPLVNGVTPLALPVYQILPRNPGSGLAGGGAVALTTSYGYIEFLPYLPDCTDSVALTVPLDLANPAAWDYVTEAPGVPAGLFALRDFYRIMGWYAALGVILNFGDQHRENAIVHRKQPHLIDLEICFKHRANELKATMLEYHFDKLNPKDDKNVLLCYDGTMHHTMGAQAGAYMLMGFNESLIWIRAQHAIISGWLAGMGNVIVRYTPRPTDNFTKRVWELYAAMIADPVPAAPVDYARKPFLTWKADDLALFYFFNGRTYRGRPLFSLNEPANDWACYLNTDAPAYYRRLNSLDLLNARGVAVAVADPGGVAGLGYVPFIEPPQGITFRCETEIPAAAGPERVVVKAKVDNAPGQNLRIQLEDNVSGLLNQPMAAAVNVVGLIKSIVVTFATDGAGLNQPPTLAQLRHFLANTPVVSALVDAALRPAAAVGAGNVAAQGPLRFMLPNTGLAFPATGHFFDIDVEGDPANNPPLTPLVISQDRLTRIQNGTEAASDQVWTVIADMGQPLAVPRTLADVIVVFRQQIADLSHQYTDAQHIVPINF